MHKLSSGSDMADIQQIVIDPVTRKVALKTTAKMVKGIDELIQVVVLSLLNSPGRDPLDYERGGGLTELIGYNISDEAELFAEVAKRVTDTEKEVLERQAGTSTIPEAKLKRINLLGVSTGDSLDEIFVRLQIVNELGRISTIEV